MLESDNEELTDQVEACEQEGADLPKLCPLRYEGVSVQLAEEGIND